MLSPAGITLNMWWVSFLPKRNQTSHLQNISCKPTRKDSSSEPHPQTPMITAPLSSLAPDNENTFRNDTNQPADPHRALPHLLPTKAPPTNTNASPLLKLPSNGDLLQGQTRPRPPTNAPEKPQNPSGNFHPPTSLFMFLYEITARFWVFEFNPMWMCVWLENSTCWDWTQRRNEPLDI